MILSKQQLLDARNAIVEPYEAVSWEIYLEDFDSEDEAIENIKNEIRDLLMIDDIKRQSGKSPADNKRTICQLIDRRNELADEDDHIELHDVMDASESEAEAIKYLTEEIEKLMNK